MAKTVGHNIADNSSAKSGFIRKFLIIFIPIAIILAFVAATALIIHLNKKPQEKRRPFNPLAVMGEFAYQDAVQLVVNTQGEARPQTEIDLVPEVAGKITYVAPTFVEGGVIRKGETLYQIDKSDFEVAVIRAEAGVARAKQALVREEAESEIARQDWEELGGGRPPSDLTLRKPQMAEAKAGLQSAEADLSNAKIQLARTSVKAPFTGRVRTKLTDIGQFVSPGSRLGRIFSTNIVEVRLPFTDDDLSKMNLPIAFIATDRASAPDVRFKAVIAGQPQIWSGKIMRTDSTYDTQTRALFAIAEVFDPYGKGVSDNGVPLAPGLFVDAEVAGKSFDNIVVLPRDGLRPENKVYVAKKDGSADIRFATVLNTTQDLAYVTAGVSDGEIVILSPMEDSRAEGPLKVLDIKDTKTVLIDPPKPKWLKEKEAAQQNVKSGDSPNKAKSNK